VFGASAAIALARGGRRVTLFEELPELLGAASGINQYRLHRGYHYPRSAETALGARDGVASFRAAFPEAVIDTHRHTYAIAREGSRTDADGFVRFLDRLGLEYRIGRPPHVRDEAVSVCVTVAEAVIDPAALRASIERQLRESGVRVELGQRANAAELERFEVVVVATYARLNELLEQLGKPTHPFQFKVVEKPVLRLPDELRGESVVVLDGPFACVDPLGTTGLSVLGHVVHAVHAANVGTLPEIPDKVAPLLNRGIVPDPQPTHAPRMLEAAAEFLPGLARAEHVGSMFTVRVTLPGLEPTDARPTLVRDHGDGVVSVFSGKIGTCIRAAEEVTAAVEGMTAPAGIAAHGRG
jgi:glycine/D-amino acid oxidase-like deaminating enzyme